MLANSYFGRSTYILSLQPGIFLYWILYQLLYQILLYRACTAVNVAVFPSGGSSSRPNGYLLQYPPCHGCLGISTWRYRQCRNTYTQRGSIQDRQQMFVLKGHYGVVFRTLSTSLPVWSFACLIFYNRPIAS